MPPLTSSESGPSRSTPTIGDRKVSTGSTYPPVIEEPEEDAGDAVTTQSGHVESASYYPDPYRQSPGDRPKLETQSSRGSTSGGSGPIRTLSNMFSRSPVERQHSDVRGGAHRGTKDYPHLPKNERDVESEERAGLFDSDEEDERPVREGEEGPRSALSESSSSSSGGRAAGRKLQDGPRGPRPSGPR